MSFWNINNPSKPKGVKDPNAILDYPVDFAAWLTDAGDTYQSHSILVTGGLTVVSSAQSAGVITPILSGGNLGETASFTVRIVTAGGRTDDRTFYLKITER